MAEQTGTVSAFLDRLIPLWTQPAGSRDDAEAAFREVYADPVAVNRTEMPVAGTAPAPRHREATDIAPSSAEPDIHVDTQGVSAA